MVKSLKFLAGLFDNFRFPVQCCIQLKKQTSEFVVILGNLCSRKFLIVGNVVVFLLLLNLNLINPNVTLVVCVCVCYF